MFPATSERVRINTCPEVNEQIRRRTECSVAWHAAAGPLAISQRLTDLDREWDIERYLETMAPSITLGGLLLGLTRSKRWLLVPLVVQGFLLQHALQGWCPPIPVLRRLGIRTLEEIHEERCALKTLRGDFRRMGEPLDKSAVHAVQEAVEAARR